MLGEPSGTPVTLVCAPSGFGKTSLVGHWAHTVDQPVAWLSLDADDATAEDLARDIVAAVRIPFPEFGKHTLRVLRKRSHVDPAEYGRQLNSDLDAIAAPFVLVLDDFDSLPLGSSHEVIDEILLHASATRRLILIARHDPPLALHQLILSGRASEIRQSELAFSPEETAAFLSQQTDWSPEPDQLERIANRLGGWPTGIRLSSQGLTDTASRERLLERLPEGVRQAQRFLCSELFERLAPPLQLCLLKCSILSEFNYELCAAVLGPESERLREAGFPENELTFLAPVDARPTWFQILPLFREFIDGQLRQRIDANGIRDLHDRAARWLSGDGHLAEAIGHALEGRDPNSAAAILAGHRMRLINEGRYAELFAQMGRLPEEVQDSHLDTRLLRVWATPSEVFHEAVSRVERMLTEQSPPTDRADAVRGELRLMQAGNIMSLSINDPSGLTRLIECAEQALDLLPTGFRGARAMAYFLLAQALQFRGGLNAADAVLDRGLAEFSIGGGHPLSLVHYTRGLVHFLEADLFTARDALQRSLACELVVPPETEPFRQQARRLLGRVHYEWNDLDTAARVLDHPGGRSYPESMRALAHVWHAQGKEREARDLMEETLAKLGQSDGSAAFLHAHSQVALLARKQGRLETALRWAEGARTEDIRPFHGALSCTLTRASILAASGESRHLQLASELLETLDRTVAQLRLPRHRIVTRALSALLHSTAGNDEEAFAAMDESLRLASTGRYVRLYLDLGAGMRNLFARLPSSIGYEDYVATIREEFAKERQASSERVNRPLPNPLSDRELDVLQLMARRLSNKEIAGLLHVSLPTVKSHALKIYQKLDVHGRRQAVEQGAALGILAEP